MSNNTDALEGGMDRSIHLTLDSIDLSIGGLEILIDVSLEVYKGELLALVGPNGAGKTSLLNCINGIYHPTEGRILFEDRDLAGARPHEVAEVGIARTFQLSELFRHMSVLENLFVGRHIKMSRGLLENGLFWGRTMKEEIEHREVENHRVFRVGKEPQK